jgi:hypothetical protein
MKQAQGAQGDCLVRFRTLGSVFFRLLQRCLSARRLRRKRATCSPTAT